MTSSGKEHWDAVFASKPPDRVSWYRPHLNQSLGFLDGAGIGKSAGVIDVGGGASTFVDDLLERGYTNVTVLDVSETALQAAKTRLGDRASRRHASGPTGTRFRVLARSRDVPLSHRSSGPPSLCRGRSKIGEARGPRRSRNLRPSRPGQVQRARRAAFQPGGASRGVR
jgi:hypothetical protein